MTDDRGDSTGAELKVDREEGRTVMHISGRLDSDGAAEIWGRAHGARADAQDRLVVDASGLDYCNSAGIALVVSLRRRQEKSDGEFELRDLPEQFQGLLELWDPGSDAELERPQPERYSVVEEVGRKAALAADAFVQLIAFVGQTTAAFGHAVLHPRSIRAGDLWLCIEQVGANALPIVLLMGVLMGLILAFQGIVILRLVGAEVYMSSLVSLSLVRELGPLTVAVILAGRTGSAFAAELGTMKINEEIDALRTMGLEPVQFLVVVRVAAAVVMMPFLTVFFELAGLAGGALVSVAVDQPFVTYLDNALRAVSMTDFAGGLFKALVLGYLVGGVGCHNGLRTTAGASAVGQSATRAVVAGLVLIVVADGVFAVLYYVLGI
jgi:phospholipid/cholesterol/gamma-HCH transport system permease protein